MNLLKDQELLELAAKAAGYFLTDGSQGYRKFRCKGGVEWNPLADDGDALRLLVKLALNIEFKLQFDLLKVGDVVENEMNYDSREEATRRAIVRAAAKIFADLLDPEAA
jgi:hypothetical protein